MVQWFKKLYLILTRRTQAQMILGFNVADLSTKMEKASLQLHRHKGDDALELVKLAVDTAKNIQLLEVNKVKKLEDLHYHLGRFEALSDLSQFIELSLDDAHYKLLQGRKSEDVKPKILKRTNYGAAKPVI